MNNTAMLDLSHNVAANCLSINTKAMLFSLSNQKVDFIAESPYDILCEIISHLDIVDLAECFDVNKNWSDRLLQYPLPWRTTTIRAYYSLDKKRVQAYEKILPIVSHHIQILFIGSRPERLQNNYIPLLSAYQFSNLRSLSIHSSSSTSKVDIADSIYNGLSRVAQTLQELSIDLTCIAHIHVSLTQILSICRQLTSVAYKTKQAIFDDDEFVTLSHTTKLTSIKLIQKLPISNISLLLQHSPNLHHITTTTFKNNLDTISMINKHCPRLVSIATNINAFEQTYRIPTATTNNHHRHHTSKLKKGNLERLIIQPLHAPGHHFLSRLKKERESLHTLCLGPYDEGALDQDWNYFALFSLPNLTYLHINASQASYNFLYIHLPRMIESYPALETVVLERIYRANEQHQLNEPTLADNIFDAISKLKHLLCLRLAGCDIRCKGFRRFMRQQQQQQSPGYQPSVLRELAINRCRGTSTTILLQYIPNIQNLQKLQLHCPDREVTLSDMTLFTQLLNERLTNLSVLELGGKALTDEAAVNIARCRSLHTLILHGPMFPRQRQAKNIRILQNSINVVKQLSF